jgi:hypothetical protein
MAFDNWIKFEDGTGGCVIQPPGFDGLLGAEEAMQIATEITGKKAISCEALPYAAGPVLNRKDDWPPGWAMTLCFSPEECRGHSSCPKRYACSE